MRLVGGLLGSGFALLMAAAALAGARPHAEIQSAPPAATVETTAAFTFRASQPALLTSFTCSLDGGEPRPCTSPVTYSGLGGGEHVFEVRLVGLNADTTPARHTWTVARRDATTACPATGPCPNPAQPQDPAPARPGAGSDADAPQGSRPAARRDRRGCAYAGNRAGQVRIARTVRATVCLLNAERAAAGLRRVRVRRALAVAAGSHARDMVGRQYFAHASADGGHVVERVRRAGYLRGARYWSLGEILAWGSRSRATPDSIVRAWMRSPAHRDVLLRPDFRDVGVHVVLGTPHPRHKHGGTFVAEFGRRG